MEYIKPGTDNKPAGTYKEIGPNGEEIEDARIVEIQQGDRLPPTQAKGHVWTMLK